MYSQRVSAGSHTSHKIILKVLKRLRESGCVTSRPRSGRPAEVRWKVQPEIYYHTPPHVRTEVQERTVRTVASLKSCVWKNPKRNRGSSIPANTSSGITGRD